MKFRHLGIVVRDLDESLDFYINKLGLSVAVDNIEEGSFIDEILGFVDCKVRTIKLKYGNTQILELLYYLNPDSKDLSNDFFNKVEFLSLGTPALAAKSLSSEADEEFNLSSNTSLLKVP